MKMFTKVIGVAVGMAAALALTTSTGKAQNLLVDGSFENGTFTSNPIGLSGVNMGWANDFGGAAPTQSSAFAQDGTYSLLTYNDAGNNWNPRGSYQIVSGVSAGQQLSLSVYALAPVALTGTYGTPIDVQIQFFDSTLNNLSTVETGWSALSAIGSWQQYNITGTAPAGTVYAAPYIMFMDNGQTATDNVYFDNASMTIVPEPSTLALLAMGMGLPFYFIRRRK